MRILTWNIRQGGGDRIPGILDFLSQQCPHIVVLTEYRPRATRGRHLRDGLRARGWSHLEASATDVDDNAILVASRTPLNVVASTLTVGVPVMALPSVWARWIEVQVPAWGVGVEGLPSPLPLTVAGLHIPGSGDKLGPKAKQMFWQAVLDTAKARSDRPAIFLGDFNSGLAIDEGGQTSLTCKNCVVQLRDDLGWRDAWRSEYPSTADYTWYSAKGGGYRLDHAWLSPRLQHCLRGSKHHHEVRAIHRLSDHSALSVELETLVVPPN